MSHKVTPENFREFKGYKTCRRSRSTRSIVSVVDGIGQGLDTNGGRWYTICEDHGTAVSHGSLTIAISHSAEPEQWCEPCREKWNLAQEGFLNNA